MEFKKKKTDSEAVKNLASQCKISNLLAELLAERNITTVNDAKKFLYGGVEDISSPYIFPDMEKAVAIIKAAIENKRKILVYGDYDCDGVGAISILYLAMKDNGVKIDYYIPRRDTEGYGLNADAVKQIAKTVAPELIVTVDCGINSCAEAALCKSLGMDIIVTDHHQPSENLPDCPILNPFLAENAAPLCGAGVVFFLIRALFGDAAAYKYIDICAVSTIADIVPLYGDNRIIVKCGLDAIRKGKCRPGIKELIYISKADMKTLNASDVGFRLAPRINAAGRLDTALIALKLFLEDDPTMLILLADQLNTLNAKRQDKTAKIFAEAMEMLKSYDFSKYRLIMLKGDWQEGIVGIVCAKLAEYFNLPTILVCKSKIGGKILKGSARSIRGVNLFGLLDRNHEKLLSYGGHAMAAGLSFENKYFEEIKETLNADIIQNTPISVFEKNVYYDAGLALRDVNTSLFDEVMQLEPFGHENPAPTFLDENPTARFKRIGKTQHIKARVKSGDAVAFDKYKYISAMEHNGYSLLYSMENNTFNGKTLPQFNVKELKLTAFDIEGDEILENFCKSFAVSKEADFSAKKESLSPKLYIAYNGNTVAKFLSENSIANVAVFGVRRCELCDTLAVAPDMDFPFFYYSEIVFLDNTGDGLKRYIASSGIPYTEKCDTPVPCPQISVDELRKLYIALSEYSKRPRQFVSAGDLYDEMTASSSFIEKNKFTVGFYILSELGLLSLSKDGIIVIINKKTDLHDSALFRYTR